jgi:hypothetical protein
MEKEKRRSKRFTLHQLIEVSYEGDLFVRAEGVDLSECGILCKTDPKLEVAFPVYLILKLELPNQAEPVFIKTDGKVVHAEVRDDGFYAGIEFDDLPMGQAAELKHYFETID